MYLAAHSSFSKEVGGHFPVVLLKKESTDEDKPVPVVNLPSVRFIYGHTNKGITGNIQGYWDPEILVSMVTVVGLPVEGVLDDIGMKSISSGKPPICEVYIRSHK